MSAVVQELYSGLPAALAAESAALSDPITVFWAKPEASELVLTCSRLPLTPQNTHGLKLRLPDYYPERLACVGNLSCPGWMALLLREPEGTGGPAEGDGTPSGRLTQQGSFQDAPREGLGAAEDMAGVAVKSLVLFPLTSKDAAGSEEKAPWLIQEGRDSFPSPSSTPRAALLQNLEESPAKEQATLSNPMLETPGATADGTRPFSETGEERTRGSVAVIPGSSECSDREVVNAKVPEIGTLVPLESLCLPSDSSTVKGQLLGEEVWECLTTSAPFSAARRTLLCLLQGGGDHLLGPGEGLRAIFNGRLPARQEETDFCDAATSTSAVLERKVPLEASLANRSLEPSAHSLSQSDLGFGTMPWEDSASIQVVCEVQGEEGCAGSNGSLTSSDGGEVELREEWAFEATMEGNPLPSDSSDELSSDGESERGTEGLADHAYSCLGRRTVGGQKVAPEEGGIKEALQKGPPSEKEGPASALKMVSPESSVSRLQDGLRLSAGAHPGSSGSGRVEKNDGSLCPHARVGGLVLGTKGGGTLSGEDDSWCCFRSSLEASEDPHSSSSSSSSSSDSVGPDRDLRKGHLLEIKTGSRHGADLLGRSSGAQLHPSRSSGIEVSSVTGKEHSETTPVGGEFPLAQQEEEMDLGGLGLMDRRLEGGPLGASAKLVTQNTRDLLRDKEVFSSLCQDGSEGLEQTSEEKVTEVGRAGSPCEESKRDLCVAKEACCTLSEDAPQDGLNEGHRRGASPAFVPERDAPLPWAQGAGDSGACLNDRGHLELLNGVENTTGALGPAGPSHPDLSLGAAAEAETQRIDPDESLIESKEIPGHGSSVFTPAANLQQKLRTGTSLVFELDHWGVGETVKTEGGRQGCELAEKPMWARNPEEAALPELDGLVEGQCKEGVEGNPYSGPSFPPESLLSDRRPHLARQGCRGSSWRLADLSPADPEQPRDTTCQMETQLCGPRNQHHLNCPVWFEQKNEALEAAASERSSLPLMSPEKPKVDPVREMVSRSAEEAPKQVSCNRQESEGLILPGLAFLLEKSIREAVQQSTGGPCEKKVPELTKNRSQDDPKELESLKRCLGGLESPCGTLTWNNQPPPVRMEEPCPVSAMLSGDPSDVPGEDHFLKWDDKPASPPHPACSRLTDLLSFIPVDGERSTRGGLLESFQHQGRGHLAVGRLGAQHLQNPALWFSQRDGPWTGPSSKTPSSPHAEGYSSGTFSIKSQAEGQAGLLVPEKDHTCCSPVQASACVDSAPGPEENGVHSEGRQPGAGRMVSGALGNPDPSSKETEPSQEEDQRGSRPAPGARGPSAVLVGGLTFPVGEDEKGGEARLPGPASLPECPSESGLAEAQEPSKCTENTERHEIGPSFPRRNILPETLSGSMTFAFRDGRALEASMLGLGRDGRGWQAVEGSGKTPGDPRELPEWLSGSPVNEVPVKTSGAAEAPGSPSLAEKAFGAEAGPVAAQPGGTCAALHQGKRTARKARAGAPSRPRILAVGRPLGSTSFQRVMSPGDLGHWAFLPRSRWRGSEKWGPHSTFWEPGRPKRSQALMGPRQREGGRGPRCLREPLRPSKDKDCPLPGLCLWSTSVGFSSMESRRAFESTPRMKSLLLFQRRTCKKVPPPGRRSKAPAEVPPLVSPAPLRPPLGMVPRPGSQQADPVCSAFPLAAGRSEGAAAWDSPPKHRGLPGSRWNPFGLSGCAKDPPLLRKLSLLADRLQGPPRKPPKTKPLRPSSELLPVPEKCHSLRSQELPEIFSCVSLQLASPWGKGGRCCFRMFSSRPLALCPIEATRACFLGLNGKAPLAFGGPVFPVSFHAPTDPGPVRDLLGREGLQSVSPRVSPGQAPGWTFAFLLSQSCLDITSTTQKDAHVSSLSAAKAQLGAAVAQNIRGLQTVLALVSPGYSRLWTKKRPLAPRSPGTPKPALLQWARGLEGLRTGSPAVPAGLCSSSWVPSSPGRALCLWRPQGPSARPPECPPLLSARGCTREPGPAAAATLSLRDSSAPVAPGADQFLDASVAVEEETRWGPPFPVLPPASCPVPERARSRLGLSSLEFQAHRLDTLDVSSAHVLPQSDSPLRKAESKKRPKKVSQIRIRKTIPRPDPNLTPMGLPRPKRLKKTEFSLEEIYTNQNYKSPPATRCLETIFEEPKERNGSLISISHQKRKRVLEFQDFTVPRKRKARGRVKVAGSFTRAQKATLEGQELDVLLIQKLMDLEAFFAEHEEEQKRDVPGS